MSFFEKIFSGEDIPEETKIEKEEGNELEEKTYAKARRKADVFLETFHFADNNGYIEKNPEKLKNSKSIFFSPGWGIIKAPEKILSTITSQGRRVVSTTFSREEILEGEDSDDFSTSEYQKALEVIEIIKEDLEKNGENKIDAIAHSEGGLVMAIAANLYPELFRSIVFVAPAGMIGKDSYVDLIKRFSIDEPNEEKTNSKNLDDEGIKKCVKDFIEYISKNPALAHKEVKAMSEADIFKLTKRLKNKGVGVGLVCGANDKVFPIEKVLENVNEGNVDHFISTKGDHGSLLFEPNQEHVLLAENLLENMNKKRD